jgi:hypothetical protein
VRHHGAAAEIGALEIGVDDRIPQVLGDVFDLRDADIAAAAGIVDQDVELPEGCEPLPGAL